METLSETAETISSAAEGKPALPAHSGKPAILKPSMMRSTVIHSIASFRPEPVLRELGRRALRVTALGSIPEDKHTREILLRPRVWSYLESDLQPEVVCLLGYSGSLAAF